MCRVYSCLFMECHLSAFLCSWGMWNGRCGLCVRLDVSFYVCFIVGCECSFSG